MVVCIIRNLLSTDHTHAHKYTHTHTYSHHVHTHVYTYALHTCTNTQTYTYIRTHTHTHTNTHTHTQWPRGINFLPIIGEMWSYLYSHESASLAVANTILHWLQNAKEYLLMYSIARKFQGLQFWRISRFC